MSLPAGKYYVGDLCYVMTDAEWEQFCAITIKGNKVLDGEFQMPDGRRFATYGTAWGDGLYKDWEGRSYCVDAGLIGCIKVEDIRAEKYDDIEELGNIIDFPVDFITTGGRDGNGTIQFGRVVIETNPQYEDEYL